MAIRKVINMRTFVLMMMTMVLLLTSGITIIGNESKVFAIRHDNMGGGDKSGGDKGGKDTSSSSHDVSKPSNTNTNDKGKDTNVNTNTNNNNNDNNGNTQPHAIDAIPPIQHGGIPGHPPVTEDCHSLGNCPVIAPTPPPASLTGTGRGTTTIGKPITPITPTPILHKPLGHHSKSYTIKYNQGWALSCRDDMSNTLLKKTGPHTKAFIDGYNDARIGDGPC